MRKERFVLLTVVALGIVFASFVVRGVGQLIVGRDSAVLVSAPIAVIGFGMLVYLFVRATLDAVGVWTIE
ncbi:hypothetical protein [Natronolimnobius baerhuensis]|uniref:Uncharacterized protein n=1 Tax=Natronolimnobius baerhuensis TaxID=253108 RepID=A0A202EDM4_9EURY|nr:hypothetical protein [Natronolimnobius baerhuensis]OVE86373.1 hypothetical protein B2G88_06240 [Natronolimnobius baerhuensis]